MTVTESKTGIDWTARAHAIGPKLAERAAEFDETDTFVAPNYDLLREQGMITAAVPAELGGGGASIEDLCRMLYTLAQYDGSTALALSMHTHLVAYTAWRWRHMKAPVEPLLKRVATEGIVLVSTGGADWLAGTGTAEKAEGGYHVTGRKIFCSGSPKGALLMTTAVTNDPQAGPSVLHLAIPMTAPGVTIVENWKAHGMRGTGSHDVTLEKVFVPDAAVPLKRPVGKWHPFMEGVALVALAIIYSVYAGIAQAARDYALKNVGKKKDDPMAQLTVGELEGELNVIRLALEDMIAVASMGVANQALVNRSAQNRTLISRHAIRAVDKAIELMSGAAFSRRMPLERMLRDVHASRFHPIQEKAQLLFSGRTALGVPVD
jgi:acyl-CoA dehydrogenase